MIGAVVDFGPTFYRDIRVIEINRWENRAYGRTHERLVMTVEG